jgi:hypothetical protein
MQIALSNQILSLSNTLKTWVWAYVQGMTLQSYIKIADQIPGYLEFIDEVLFETLTTSHCTDTKIYTTTLKDVFCMVH